MGVGAAPAAAQQTAPPSFVVDLAEDGSAQVTLSLTYDLNDADEREAFQQLRNDSQARNETRSDFRARMEAVANDSENATGREMAIRNASIDLRTIESGDIGVVELSVTWVGLAAVDGETLTVTEPFASGFEPDRTFIVLAPDGYVVTEVTPEPNTQSEGRITYKAGTSLDGFAATFAPESTPTAGEPTATEPSTPGGEESGTSQPGFGVIVAVAALLAAALLARRR